jgi:thioredoxin-like negative regulator of GroEL
MAVSDTEQAMRKFMNAGGWTFPVMLCPDDIAAAYGVGPIPTIIVLDSQGRVVETMVGGASASELSELVDDLVP